MQRASLELVGLVDVVEGSTRADAQDVIESRTGVGFMSGNFITDAEDFAI